MTSDELKARNKQLSSRNKKDMETEQRKRQSKNRSMNARMHGKRTTNNTVANNREAYANYIQDIPKGLGADMRPGLPVLGGLIVNTAYKGQKTVQSHVLSGTQVSHPTSPSHADGEMLSISNATYYNFPGH
jgi:hypothetical protein